MGKSQPTEALRCHPSSGVGRASSSATQGGPIPPRTYVCPGTHKPTDLIRLPKPRATVTLPRAPTAREHT